MQSKAHSTWSWWRSTSPAPSVEDEKPRQKERGFFLTSLRWYLSMQVFLGEGPRPRAYIYLGKDRFVVVTAIHSEYEFRRRMTSFADTGHSNIEDLGPVTGRKPHLRDIARPLFSVWNRAVNIRPLTSCFSRASNASDGSACWAKHQHKPRSYFY